MNCDGEAWRAPMNMQALLSLPENLVSTFHEITGKQVENWFVVSDPKESKIGSGGGTAFLLAEHKKNRMKNAAFGDYLSSGKKIIVHAGGHSRRLPAYAPSGKILAPIPIMRWSRGQRLDQTLLDMQMPFLERVMDASGPSQNVLIAAGDVLIQSPEIPFELPAVDVVCIGIWVDPYLASHHGVFFTPRNDPQLLDFMLQKPEHEKIELLASSHLYLLDTGVWVLSNRACELIMKKSGWNGSFFTQKTPSYYDIFSTFGSSLGLHPIVSDVEISKLSVAVVPMDKGVFYHYGTSYELISSTEKNQDRVQDQRSIWHFRVKPHNSLFVQNAIANISWNQNNHHVWIENSHIPSSWQIHHDHVITGVPENAWNLTLNPGICLDIIPVGESGYCVRPYGIKDKFRGTLGEIATEWMGEPVINWLKERGISYIEAGLSETDDIQQARLFPAVELTEKTGGLIRWMLNPEMAKNQKDLWLSSPRLSADQINDQADLKRLCMQRSSYRKQNLSKLAVNYKHSVFYQADLKHAAKQYCSANLGLPDQLPESESAMVRFRDRMFRSEVLRLKGLDYAWEEAEAFRVLQASITDTIPSKSLPRLNVFTDQIVWGRSPARLDLAGGWSDTPPYCLQNGGSVLNVAAELNGQPPIQVYIRPCNEKRITLRSIDNGISETVASFEDLRAYGQVGSVFSIPKAALCLVGFHPDFCDVHFKSLEEQLTEFRGGFEISLLVAIPKGSGLGTSSILAATMLGSLSDFCSLNWDHHAICHRTLVLEQLLTTGGGWQDQYGGVLPGIKFLESEPGTQEKVSVRWMPDRLFTQPQYKDNWLLYYTGVTRVAKSILTEIVRGMFLNEGCRLQIVDEIRQHAYRFADAVQRSEYAIAGKMVAHSWKLNNALDSGTNTPEIQKIIDLIQDYSIGFKLLGAGGGGYMIIAAKDPEAAGRIQSALTRDPPNDKGRFVRMEVSQTGFQVSRS